jgi:hypothetical protein
MTTYYSLESVSYIYPFYPVFPSALLLIISVLFNGDTLSPAQSILFLKFIDTLEARLVPIEVLVVYLILKLLSLKSVGDLLWPTLGVESLID